MNRELNSQLGIRGQDSHFSEVKIGAPPTSMPLWGAHTVLRKYIRDTYDRSYTHVLTAVAECGTTALGVRHCRT